MSLAKKIVVLASSYLLSFPFLIFGYFPFMPPEAGEKIIQRTPLEHWMTSAVTFMIAMTII